MSGSSTFLLSNYPGDVVRLACRKCDRAGQYRKAALIKRYGGHRKLPDLRVEIAHCPKMGSMSDGCGVYFVELARAP
jgi:hypothetical protein